MTSPHCRRYPRNSPQAAGRILAAALLANGDIQATEWQRLAETQAVERLGLPGLQWHAVLDELCQDLMAAAQPGQSGLFDQTLLQAWLAEIDAVPLQALVLELCAEVIEADGEVQPGESMVLRAALAHWVLPVQDQARVEPLVYGLDFQVVPRRAVASIEPAGRAPGVC